MNKSLETEYKDLVRADLPDLWGRIEAKLDAQEKAAQTNVVEFPKTVANAQNVQIDKKEQLQRIFADPVENTVKTAEPVKKRKKTIPWQYFGVAAAAVLCLLVVIPAMSNMKQASSTMMAPQAAMSGGDSAASSSVPASAGNSVTMSETAAEPAVESQEAAESADEEYEYGKRGDQKTEIRDVSESVTESECDDANYSYSMAQHVPTESVAELGGGTQSSATAGERDSSEVPALGNADEAGTAPAAVTKGTKALFVLAVDESATEEQLEQMMDRLQQDLEPWMSLVLQEAGEQEYFDAQNDRFTHVMVLAGDMSVRQRKEEVDHILQELQNYDFVTIRDVQLTEE